MEILWYNKSMIDVYYTYDKVASDDFIKMILAQYYNIPNAVICKSINGKPYIDGRKIHFNLTHSKEITALAVGKKRVGFDCECLTGKPRPAVLNKFTDREKGEIFSVSDFYTHWTARESYIKFYGETLANMWRKVEFFRGAIYAHGEKTDMNVIQFEMNNYVFSICGDYSKVNLHEIKTNK